MEEARFLSVDFGRDSLEGLAEDAILSVDFRACASFEGLADPEAKLSFFVKLSADFLVCSLEALADPEAASFMVSSHPDKRRSPVKNPDDDAEDDDDVDSVGSGADAGGAAAGVATDGGDGAAAATAAAAVA